MWEVARVKGPSSSVKGSALPMRVTSAHRMANLPPVYLHSTGPSMNPGLCFEAALPYAAQLPPPGYV